MPDNQIEKGRKSIYHQSFRPRNHSPVKRKEKEKSASPSALHSADLCNSGNQKRESPHQDELKINSRAALLASGLAELYKSRQSPHGANHGLGRKVNIPTSQTPLKEGSKTASYSCNKVQCYDAPQAPCSHSHYGSSKLTINIQRENATPSPEKKKTPMSCKDVETPSTPRNCGYYGIKTSKIRSAWKVIDSPSSEKKTLLGKKMKNLYAELQVAEVGTLSTLFAQNTKENLSDDINHKSENRNEDLSLAESAQEIMNSWQDHTGWTKEDARLAGQILIRMEMEEVLGGGSPIDYYQYLLVINAYAKVTAEDEMASFRSENILDHMERRSQEGRIDLKIDRLSINTAIGAHAKGALCGTLNMKNVSAAERMLDLLEREYAAGDCTMRPTERSYSKLIDAYAKNGMAEKASHALERMEVQYCNGNVAACPQTIHYTNVIDAFAKIAHKSSRAALTAEEVLRSMLDLYEKGHSHLKPDTLVFSAAIDAWSKSNVPNAPEHSLNLLDLMDYFGVAPDIVTFNIVIDTLAKSEGGYYLRKAEDILQFIETSPTLIADSFTYNALLKGMHPIDAERLIQHWEMEYKMGRTDERPDTFSYTSLIKAWTMSNVKGFEEKCIKILDWMEEMEVVGMNRIAYNEVIKSFARSRRHNAGENAEKVYQRLVARYEQSRDREMRPDKYTYMGVLNACSRSCKNVEDAQKAEDLLYVMIDRRDIPNPDSRLCNEVISAWARSGAPDAITRAEQLCDLMDSIGIDVDGVCYNSLISVYSKSNEPGEGAKAIEVLHRMKDRRICPTSVTYTLLIEACIEDRESLCKVFDDCTQEGMLDKRLMESFRKNGPPYVQEQIQGGLRNLPSEWSQYANRGPDGMSRSQIKRRIKRGNTGANINHFGWAR